MIVILFLCIAACSRKSFESLDETGTYMISYSLVPDMKYTISAQFIRKYSNSQGTSESDYFYEYLLETGDLSSMEISLIDTSFHNRSIVYNIKTPIKGNLIPESKHEEDATICHYSNGREIIIHDSLIHSEHYRNSFSHIGIGTWNSQEDLPNCSMRIGESHQIETSEWEFNYNEVPFEKLIVNTTNYILDSVNNNKCYIKFDSQFHWQDSLHKLARKEYGSLVFDIKNKHFRKIEKFTDDIIMQRAIINGEHSTIETATSSHNIVKISVVDE